MANKPNTLIGSPIERFEDLRFLTGRGKYVDDLSCANLLHAVILRSSVAHGYIRSIDTTAALARPGVYGLSPLQISDPKFQTFPFDRKLSTISSDLCNR